MPCRLGMGKIVPPLYPECSVSWMKLVGMPRRVLLTCQVCHRFRVSHHCWSGSGFKGYVAPNPVTLNSP